MLRWQLGIFAKFAINVFLNVKYAHCAPLECGDCGIARAIDIAILWIGRVDTRNCPPSKCKGYFFGECYVKIERVALGILIS